MSTRCKRVLAICATIVLGLLASGCASRFKPPFVVKVQSASAEIKQTGPTRVIAQCPEGSTLIGGGFNIPDADMDPGVLVRGSYPLVLSPSVAPSTWLVEVENTARDRPTSSHVMALAYCVTQSPPRLKMEVATAQANTMGVGPLASPVALYAQCTPGSVVTGGGFRIDGDLNDPDATYSGGIMASLPTGTFPGWALRLGQLYPPPSNRMFTAFALCAVQGLQPGKIMTAPYPATAPLLGSFTASQHCPDGTFTSAGGFDNSSLVQVHRILESAATNDLQDWTTYNSPESLAGNTLTMSAACIPIP